jgi:rhodanese-related sulfurtransferase
VADESAAGLAAQLIEDGYDPAKVRVLEDGLAGWEAAGLPVEREPG